TLLIMCSVAELLVMLNRGAEAIPMMDELANHAEGKFAGRYLPQNVMNLLSRFEKTKDAAGCQATARLWEKLKRTDAGSLYTSACMRAVTAAVISKAITTDANASRLAKVEADRAMAWAKQAVAAGFKNVGRMKADKDLDALRDREDFKKLLVE